MIKFLSLSPSIPPTAQFIFHREQRETLSLKSYFDSREQGSPDTGWKPQANSTTSPLATVSTGVSSGGWQREERGERGRHSVDGSSRGSSGGWQRRETTDSGAGEPVPSKYVYINHYN